MTSARPQPGPAPDRRAVPRLLEATSLSAGYGATEIVHGVDLAIPAGRITAILGANASGKSTLLKTAARVLRPLAGAVLLDGRSIAETPTRELAKRLGLLPQQPIAPEGIVVADLVARGRHPHEGLFGRRGPEDERIVAESLAATRILDLADRPVDELSGGQRQRVWIAMALAQRTDVLLLDEPTTYLDLAHQIEVLDLLADLNAERGTTIAMVLHDLALAARYVDWLIAMKDGRIVAEGTPGDVLTEELVREVFGLESHIVEDPVSGTPLVVPIGRRRLAEARR